MAELTDVGYAKDALIEKIRELAWLRSDYEEFTLASGRKSRHFFDMKPVMMDPECAHFLGVLIHDELTRIGEVDSVGGLELGAVPLTGIAIAKANVGSNLKGFIIRKEPKGRGGRKTGNPPGIEGSTLSPGDRCVILEDVTTTGGSALKAVERLIGSIPLAIVFHDVAELVFANTFGMTRDEFFADFDSWIYLSEEERKIVIPTVEEQTGRLYHP